MPTHIIGVNIPDFPGGGGSEICHGFTLNYLYQQLFQGTTIQSPNGYLNYGNWPDLFDFLTTTRRLHRPPGTVIQRGDILIFSLDPNNIQQQSVTHSMIAIRETSWYGTNNHGTFGVLWNNNAMLRQAFPAQQLAGRCQINNINQLQLGQAPVYDARNGAFTTNNPAYVSVVRTPNINPHVNLFIHIFR